MDLPLEYDVVLQKGTLAPVEIQAGSRPPLAAGPPPELGGSDAWWSPLVEKAERLCFVSASLACPVVVTADVVAS